MTILKVEKLWVKAGQKWLLKDINWQINAGETQVLLGPNASGKSTFAATIAGLPPYKVTQGKIIFESQDITAWPPEKRARQGIALSWQSPPKIPGVTLAQLLDKINPRADIDPDIIDPRLLSRDLNANFSGGEKKMAELSQIMAMKPKLVIFDEIDAGLDIKRLTKTVAIIQKTLIRQGVALLVITHRGDILRILRPQRVNIMLRGQLICQKTDYQKVYRTIKKYGYEKCKDCLVPAD